MKVATAQELRNIDHEAIYHYGIPEIALMENAGVEVAKAVEKVLGDVTDKKICIFASKGNNGGDGFVAARHLANNRAKVRVFVIGGKNSVKASAKINLDILISMGIAVLDVESEREWNRVSVALNFADCAIDALLGTGFRSPLRPDMEKIIHMINEAVCPTIAVDIPSGVEADSGQVQTTAIEAVATPTFGIPKLGLYLYPGSRYTGEIILSKIGIPNDLLSNGNIKQNIINTNMASQLFMQRRPEVHKGSCGRVLVVAGSNGLTGAATLSSMAALRAGAGLVTLAIPKSLQDIVEIKLTEVMTYPLSEKQMAIIGMEAIGEALQLAEKADVIAIGPGLGRDEDTFAFVREFVKQTDKQLVIDADAIHAFAIDASLLRTAKRIPIITPHLGEMANLLGKSIEEIQCDLIETARQTSIELNVIVVLKSARTVVAYPDGNVYINIIGNAGMATGGSGDVLTGIISGLLAQGMLSYSAAVAGVYLHAFAGDLAAQSGMVGLIASDILHKVPSARANICKS